MAGARYTRYLGELDLEELLQNLMGALEDFFLFSGFPLSRWRRSDPTLADLHDAILDALLQGGVLDETTLERLLRRYPGTTAEQLEQLVQEIMERLQSEGYITTVPERPSALHPEGHPDPD
jgi:DNA-binding GntR family transcriptional regulator